MRGCVPQRQILPCKNWIISAELGLVLLCRSPTLLMIIPVVQYAHWNAPASRKACCTGCRCPSFSRPSMVVTGLPTAALTGIWQERRGIPPISTVQAPHWPSPQPYLLPVKPSSSRRTYSRGVSGSYCTGYRLPFTSISIALGIVSPILPPFGPGSVLVASVAGRFGVTHFVTAQAAVHGDDAGDFRHGVHLAHRTVARFAFHPRGQMRAVRPRNAGQNGVRS